MLSEQSERPEPKRESIFRQSQNGSPLEPAPAGCKPGRGRRNLCHPHTLSSVVRRRSGSSIIRLSAQAKDHAVKQPTDRSPCLPQGWHTVTPRIVVHDAKMLVQFLQQVFGASGDYRDTRPSEMRIGDSIIMISDAGIRAPMT